MNAAQAVEKSHVGKLAALITENEALIRTNVVHNDCYDWPHGFEFLREKIGSESRSCEHIDNTNLGPSKHIGLGNFDGGDLWVEDKFCKVPFVLKHDVDGYQKCAIS